MAGETGEGDPRAVPLDVQNRLLPQLCLPEVFDLQHQANQVVPLFALEAVIGEFVGLHGYTHFGVFPVCFMVRGELYY